MTSLRQGVAAPRVPGPIAGTLSAWDKVFRQRSLPRCSFGFHEGLTLRPSVPVVSNLQSLSPPSPTLMFPGLFRNLSLDTLEFLPNDNTSSFLSFPAASPWQQYVGFVQSQGPEEERFAFLLTVKKSLGGKRETLKEQENKIDINSCRDLSTAPTLTPSHPVATWAP